MVVAIGLVTVVAVDSMISTQDAEAKGCNNGIAVNASKGGCFHP
jgi:hypothetical protein